MDTFGEVGAGPVDLRHELLRDRPDDARCGPPHAAPRGWLLEPDSKIDEYREVRAALAKRWQEIVAQGDQPGAVADVVLKAANAARPKLRCPVGRVASMRVLRRFAPAGVADAAVRKNLQLDALTASLPRTPALEK